jgi:hypothetical protein
MLHDRFYREWEQPTDLWSPAEQSFRHWQKSGSKKMAAFRFQDCAVVWERRGR